MEDCMSGSSRSFVAVRVYLHLARASQHVIGGSGSLWSQPQTRLSLSLSQEKAASLLVILSLRLISVSESFAPLL